MSILRQLGRFVKTSIALFLIFSFVVTSCSEKKKETKPKIEKTSSELEKQVDNTIYGYNKDSVDIVKNTIKRNQNLSDILSSYKVSYQKIHEIATAAKPVYDVRKLGTNKEYEIIFTKDSSHQAKCFIYHPNPINYVIYKFDDTVSVSMEQFPVASVEKTTTGIISSSLYNTLIDNGNSPKLAVELSDVYAWQIDFFGIQKGDNYKIIFDELYVNDESIGVGEIKAAYFDHLDTTYYAFRYEQDSKVEYFDEKGNSLRKAFLKAPLSYRRISSKFSHNRLHPILKRRMPHLGVDYAAPRGTPIYSIGDGKVIKANHAGAAGNYVKIKHNSVYTTGYMHLWKFEKGIRPGTLVKQGQLIGYVGSTGRSTGPHLDFRIWKNGQAIDSLSLKPPSVRPINESYKTAYLKKMGKYKKALDKV
ncbi:MAG: peptidoglycan DD-metalloendopeptidase family protein [Bacteroidota bacterium]